MAIAVLHALITLYRWFLSPWLGGHCRFHPTCSEYAQEALRLHGAGPGLWLTLRRLGRCHPFGGSGFDPVPSAGDVQDGTVVSGREGAALASDARRGQTGPAIAEPRHFRHP